MSPPPNPYRFAAVYWLDAFDYHYEEGTESLRDKPGLMQLSIGAIIRDDSECIKLAATIDAPDDLEEGEEPGPRFVMTIPRGMVKRVEILSPKPQRRSRKK